MQLGFVVEYYNHPEATDQFDIVLQLPSILVSAYEKFSWYKYLIVSLVFSHLGFWSGNLFLIAPFPDLCLLVLFCVNTNITCF